MKKNGAKKETRHLQHPHNAAATVCGREIGKVLLWAKKTPPKVGEAGVCNRCYAIQSGRIEKIEKSRQAIPGAEEKTDLQKVQEKGARRTARIVAKHEAIRKLQALAVPGAILKESEARKPGKRQPALLVLGDRMPKTIEVNFKGNRTVASVNPDGSIVVPDGQYYKTFNSPSRAGKHVAGREVDGWTFWSTLLGDGSLEKLDALRKAVA